jgi:hypothetical protein
VWVGNVSPPDEDGWVTLPVQFEAEDEACEYVLSFGPRIEVIEPEALRHRVISSAENVVALYRGHVWLYNGGTGLRYVRSGHCAATWGSLVGRRLRAAIGRPGRSAEGISWGSACGPEVRAWACEGTIELQPRTADERCGLMRSLE